MAPIHHSFYKIGFTESKLIYLIFGSTLLVTSTYLIKKTPDILQVSKKNQCDNNTLKVEILFGCLHTRDVFLVNLDADVIFLKAINKLK